MLVCALEIDVANQLHHDLEPIELFGPYKGIFVPGPIQDLALTLVVALQTDAVDLVMLNQFLAASQLHIAADIEHRQEIIFIGEITDGPYEPGCRSFGLGFVAQLDSPANAGFIAHVELGIHSVEFFLDKRQLALGLMVGATWTIKKVTGLDVGWFTPDHGLR